ncbi:hypothetical protein D7294_14620 [Streptomyces hoynatensis]|uniref:Uncharacterized protein n=1 Tax=Streptomyces hoynatensis TaxID=1141874 RepID=A0A3A9Z2Q1_9ACTN|nr:hypothetical protein D7294_14620 [Streptomyces hoynatensis]
MSAPSASIPEMCLVPQAADSTEPQGSKEPDRAPREPTSPTPPTITSGRDDLAAPGLVWLS